MKFKIGDAVEITENSDVDLPIGSIGTVIQTDENDFLWPYQIESCGGWYWCSERDLEPISEKGEKTEMPKQKDFYDFDNMTNDDLDRLISEANDVLISRKKDRMLRYLDDAINAMKEFLQFDGNCAMTSEGYSTVDILNELKELRAYYN